MRKNEDVWRTAMRFGVPFGVGLAVLGSLNGVLQARRHAVDPSAHWLTIFSYLWLLATIIGVVLASQMSARASGSLGVGIRAGAITSAISTTIVFFIFVFSTALQNQLTGPSSRDDPLIVNVLLMVVILLLFSVVGGGLIGALVAIPGALFGRWQARIERLNASSLPEQPPITMHESDAPLPETPSNLDDDALMEMIEASSEDIVINPSGPKSLLFFLMASALTAGSYAMASSGQNTVIGWVGVSLFGIGILLPLVNMALNRPLLRFSVRGIAYKGAVSFWLRGQVPWQNIRLIALMPASSRLFGRYDVYVYLGNEDSERLKQLRFQNWQLPRSTHTKLHAIMIRFHRQIEENDVVVHGVE